MRHMRLLNFCGLFSNRFLELLGFYSKISVLKWFHLNSTMRCYKVMWIQVGFVGYFKSLMENLVQRLPLKQHALLLPWYGCLMFADIANKLT